MQETPQLSSTQQLVLGVVGKGSPSTPGKNKNKVTFKLYY